VVVLFASPVVGSKLVVRTCKSLATAGKKVFVITRKWAHGGKMGQSGGKNSDTREEKLQLNGLQDWAQLEPDILTTHRLEADWDYVPKLEKRGI